MSARKDMICIGTPAWDGNYAKSTIELLKELSGDFRILYVDYQYTLKDMAATLVGRQQAPLLRMSGLQRRLRTVEIGEKRSITVLTPPPFIPVNWIEHAPTYDRIHALNAARLLRTIRRAMHRLGMERPVVLNAFNPSLGIHCAGKLDESLLVYYCYDNISAAGWLGKHGERTEQEFVRMTDGIITSSDALRERFAGYDDALFTVKNGVDLELMNEAFTRTAAGGQRTVGYIGSIDERIDFPLLEDVIIAMPEHRFLFVGRITDASYRTRLARHHNVEHAGAHPLSALPAFLRRMDVCIIPFAQNDFNTGVYPMKVNEYLAAGKPVVMTPFAHLPEFDGVVHTAGTPHTFTSAITSSLLSDSDELRTLRREFAGFHSWEQRAQEFSTILHTLSERKGAAR